MLCAARIAWYKNSSYHAWPVMHGRSLNIYNMKDKNCEKNMSAAWSETIRCPRGHGALAADDIRSTRNGERLSTRAGFATQWFVRFRETSSSIRLLYCWVVETFAAENKLSNEKRVATIGTPVVPTPCARNRDIRCLRGCCTHIHSS